MAGAAMTQTVTNATINTCIQTLQKQEEHNLMNKLYQTIMILLDYKNEVTKVLFFFQLRTAHATVNGHLYRIHPARNPNCSNCHTNIESVQQLLLQTNNVSSI
jgi:5S rRNA maturation endonuclease (ribonuclease M5)